MEKQLRKQQNRLADAGWGTILFGIWSVIKVNMYLGLASSFVSELYQGAEAFGELKDFVLGFFWFVFAMILVFYLAVRSYIGLAAMAEGKGKKKGCGYLIVTVGLVVMTLMDIWNIYIEDYLVNMQDITMNLITGFCLELASLYVLLEVLVAGLRVKQLKKKRKE